MTHAEKCPVCGGTGTVDTTVVAGHPVKLSRSCHGCDGKGWVVVTELPEPEPPPVVMPRRDQPGTPMWYKEPTTGDPPPPRTEFYCGDRPPVPGAS